MPDDEVHSVLHHFYVSNYIGHFGPDKTVAKILQAGLYWPIVFKDVRKFVLIYDRCQRIGNISKWHEMPQSALFKVELFNIWGIDFMGLCPLSYNNLYILIVVDYVPKWVEAVTTPTMAPSW